MKVIDCECGATLQAANDADLAAAVMAHVSSDHPDMAMGEAEAQSFVAAKSYEASDS